MIVQKFKENEYFLPKFADAFVDSGRITIGGIEFISITDVKRLKNAVRAKKTSNNEDYKEAVKRFQNDFKLDGGWNPQYPAGLYCTSYDSQGNKYQEFLGFHTKAFASTEIGYNPPFAEVKFDKHLSDKEVQAIKLRLKGLENRIADRTTENPIKDSDIELNIRRAKDSWNDLYSEYEEDGFKESEITSKLSENQMGVTLEVHLQTILKEYGKRPDVRKWSKLINSLLGKNTPSKFCSVVTTTEEATEWFDSIYDGEGVWKGQTINGGLKFADSNKIIPQEVFEDDTELYKPFYIYSSSIDRFVMHISKQIQQEILNGDNIKWILFLGIHSGHTPTEKNIDKNRKTMMENLNECLSAIHPSSKERIKVAGFIGQKNTEEGQILKPNV
jgi:hypothetical protein